MKVGDGKKFRVFNLKTPTPTLNGKAVGGVKISHEDIMRGGAIEL